jgi:hypothetical protein
MSSWCIPILVAVIAATATLSAVIFRRYFEIKSGCSAPARKLLASAEQTLAWVENPDRVLPHEEIPTEDYNAFESSIWPRQQKKLMAVWQKYHSANGLIAKAPLLRELIRLIKKYSGLA